MWESHDVGLNRPQNRWNKVFGISLCSHLWFLCALGNNLRLLRYKMGQSVWNSTVTFSLILGKLNGFLSVSYSFWQSVTPKALDLKFWGLRRYQFQSSELWRGAIVYLQLLAHLTNPLNGFDGRMDTNWIIVKIIIRVVVNNYMLCGWNKFSVLLNQTFSFVLCRPTESNERKTDEQMNYLMPYKTASWDAH